MDPYNPQYQAAGPRPHPYLHEPLLYITNLPAFVSDENLALAFVNCGPFRPKIQRDGVSHVLSGVIEFKFLEKAEKALAILQSRNIPESPAPVPLVLSPYPPTNPPTALPPPSAQPRLVKQLPLDYTDSQLYDLFRPFGALSSVRAQTQLGPDIGIVEFWNEEDALLAEGALHCAEIEGQNIAVQPYQPRRAAPAVQEFNAAAPSFVPSGVVYPPFGVQYSPPRQNPYSPVRSPVQPPSPFVHGPGQQIQLAPSNGPGAGSHSGLIDPCNLFCKNLSPEIDSKSLFEHFSRFGQIVSARVMRNDNGESRGFGFVSYHHPEHANDALKSMNGAILGTKQIVVRLHEPKQLRQEKLAHRFSHSGHPRRSSSGATSPAASEAGESYSGWNSPRTYTQALASPALSPKPPHYERNERGRRGSGSYYTAALNGTLNVPLTYNSLSALSPVVRKEVLTGEFSRRVKALDDLDDQSIDAVVDSLVSLSLSNVFQFLDSEDKLKEKVDGYKAAHPPQPKAPAAEQQEDTSPPRAVSEEASQDSRLLDYSGATASAPEHPSTPVSVSPSLLTPPRTSSPAGSLPPRPERDRIFAAIARLENEKREELTELIMSLPKRERAMCLFNAEILRAKLVDAKMVLDSEDGDDAPQETTSSPAPTPTTAAPVPAPVTPQSKKTGAATGATPQTPDLSFGSASAAASPSPATPTSTAAAAAPGQGYTLATLARLPAAEIVRILSSSSAPPTVPKADPLVVQATDAFVDGLLGKDGHAQKQAVGEKLFKILKSLGVKGAPKITIALLDQEDLRATAHLMNSYPAVLKEKALALGK